MSASKWVSIIPKGRMKMNVAPLHHLVSLRRRADGASHLPSCGGAENTCRDPKDVELCSVRKESEENPGGDSEEILTCESIVWSAYSECISVGLRMVVIRSVATKNVEGKE
ncbi:hypothetical protein NPIL_503471 [Nephila pilipes]|uniref:Uncharacterized protein n=1 Tax=Nephila pilipes TaxID=299642 RepID=A0A8X6NWI8_NEPPI|nr:hypothetical protein NPIL_503471 [Nephila pilipes]